ncbi:MAG: hypothetical protein K2X38_06030 [Gemmataceae bacterium]|nr:hypothetical protein [Gemmataceae bacterium]
MNPLELAVGGTLAFVLVALAIFLGTRVKATKQSLRERTDIATDERIYLHSQIRRRTWCVVLLVGLALLLIGNFLLEPAFRDLAPEGDQKMTEAQRSKVSLFVFYWGTAVAMLFMLLGAALFDAIATAKFGMRQHRQLEETHYQELQAEAARIRQRRAELN